MVTNAKCTIIRTNDDGEYSHVGSYDCMWQETNGYMVDDNGEKRVSKAAVYIPDLSADVKKGDYVAKNTIITSKITEDDVDKMLTAMAVTKYDYGSLNMQHIRVVAQ